MTQPFQWIITSSGVSTDCSTGRENHYKDLCIADELPENFQDACGMAYDHCKDCDTIRVYRLDRDTGTFVSQTNEVIRYVAEYVIEDGEDVPKWVEDAIDFI